MKRRCFLALFVLIALTASLYCNLHHAIPGWLRGEALYRGRPTSYWRNEINRWEGFRFPSIDGAFSITEFSIYHRAQSPWQKQFRWLLPEQKDQWPALFDGDPEGRLVLQQLANDADLHVHTWGSEGLRRIESGEKGPFLRKDYWPDGRYRLSDTDLAPRRVNGLISP